MAKPLALILEDDVNVAEFFSLVLEHADYTVKAVHRGEDLLQALRTAVPHLVMLDMFLPDMNGREVLQAIRSDLRWQDVWVIFATGEGKVLDREIEQQADFVLNKPVDFEQVLQLANRVRNRSRKVDLAA